MVIFLLKPILATSSNGRSEINTRLLHMVFSSNKAIGVGEKQLLFFGLIGGGGGGQSSPLMHVAISCLI